MILALNKFYKGGPPKDKAIAMVEVISELARDAGVNVFRRFAFMKGLYQGRAGLIRPVGQPNG